MERPAADQPLYNSRILHSYIQLIRKRYDYIDIDKLLAYAGMELCQVMDEGHWFTQENVNRFHERLRKLTGNRAIGREAGLFSASPEALGGISRYLLGLVSPARAYALVGRFTNKFTRSSVYRSRKVGPHTVEITATPNEGIREQPFQCENRLGYIESISRLFNYKLPKIEHPECLFRGDPLCRYLVTWRPSPSDLWRKIRTASVPVLALSLLATWLAGAPAATFGVLVPLSIALVVLLTWYAGFLQARELQAAVNQLEHSSDDLIRQIDVNYETALMVNEIGQVLSRKSDIDSIMKAVVRILENRLDFDRGMILLSDDERRRLVVRAGFGYESSDLLRLVAGSGFHLDREESRGIFVQCFREKRPFLVNDIDDIRENLSPRSLDFARRMGVKSFICCPIVAEDDALGVLAVDNIRSKRPLLQRDVHLLMGIAPQIGVCIKNARMVEARFKQFQSILHVLVASTEARDPITAGHSQKVTEYAVGICRQLNLPQDYTDVVRVAASLHDYGKIGFDDAILKKPGRLNNREYELIKTHTIKTRNILDQVNFEGIYRDVPRIASSHHEKVDGTGYPDALQGADIPLGGKIIAVADVFEALTSKRHYRDPMRLEEAMGHLVENIGVHFDKKCVAGLIRHYHFNVAPVPLRFAHFVEAGDATEHLSA